MSFEVIGTFDLEAADEGPLAVHIDRLRFLPALSIKTTNESAKGVSALLIVHSLAGAGLDPMPDVGRNVHVDRPGLVVGHGQPEWARQPVSFRTPPRALSGAPFSTATLNVTGRAFLPYVPNTLDFAELHGADDHERAYQRGSLRGRTVFGAALHVSDQEDMSDWYQLVGFYEPASPVSVRIDVRTSEPRDTAGGETPRVFWEAALDYGDDEGKQ